VRRRSFSSDDVSLVICFQRHLWDCLFDVVLCVYTASSQNFDLAVSFGFSFRRTSIDALGNFFGMYGQQFGPLQYDEFAHMMIQVLVSPSIVWLVQHTLEKSGHHLPVKLTAFFAATTVFSLSAFYEIIDYGTSSTFILIEYGDHWIRPPTLQFDLCGIVIGTLLACALLRTQQPASKSILSGAGA
jgi:uncharacterized membrane protein YjdF